MDIYSHFAESGQPLVSIIIPTLNSGSVLRECLDSIAAQLIKNMEVIVVDGGSTDETTAICLEYSPRVKWSSAKDNGVYDAYNKGIAQATGRWLYFMGADDRLLPDFSELAIKLKDPQGIYYGDSEAFHTQPQRTDHQLLPGRYSKYRLAKYCLNHQAILYPAGVFRKYQYNLQYKVLADYHLNLLLWGDDDFKKVHYPIKIVRYHMNGFSFHAKDERFEKDKESIIRKSLGRWIFLRYRLKQLKRKIFKS